MRCVDVIRELAAPTDTRNTVDLAEHLNRCPSCANWARQATQFDRLWDTTRPAEPSPERVGEPVVASCLLARKLNIARRCVAITACFLESLAWHLGSRT